MRKNKISMIFMSFIFIMMIACTESYMGIEQVSTSSTNPDKIIVNKVIPKSGALEIHFTLPKGNPDITQIVASYTSKQEKKMEFKVSRYSSSILVEGFTGIDEVTVELVCIDNSGNESEITYVKAAPLISPVEAAFKTMKAEPAFGGVKIEWENLSGSSFIIHVLSEDTLQKGVSTLVEDLNKTIYSSDSLNTFSFIRPFLPHEQKFGFIISDKWGNRSDTLINSMTPYKEERIDYKKIQPVNFFNWSTFSGLRDYDKYGVDPNTGIQNDGNFHNATTYGPQTIFNGNRPTNAFYMYKFIKNLDDPDMSKHELIHDAYITYDLNQDVRLSRVVLFPRPSTTLASHVRRFRIYGTDDSNENRATKFPEGWTLIGEYVGRDPIDENNMTPDEIKYFFEDGQEHVIDEGNINIAAEPTKVFRYMRIHFMEGYSISTNRQMWTLNEFEMFGEVLNTY